MEMTLQQLTGGKSTQRATLFWLTLLCSILVIAGCLGRLPSGMAGQLPFVMALGGVLNALGERLGVVREYLGGGPVLVIFGSSFMVAMGIIPVEVTGDVSKFIKDDGFLSFYISALITGSLLGMDRKLLLKSAIWYLPVILGGVIFALLLTGLIGFLLGEGFLESVFYIALPIMGGGMGAGALPLAEIFANILDTNAADVLSRMVPAVILGNLVAIIAAGLLEKLGKVRPELSGDGKLMKSQVQLKGIEETVESIPDLAKMGTGLFVATGLYVIGYILNQFIALHPYALMILCVGVIKALGVMPDRFEQGAALWGDFVVISLTPALLACIGIGFTKLHLVTEVISIQYLVLVVATVVGAILGTAIVGRLLGFYAIEASITAGLCMANMGGTGDVAVLSASRRMNLMPFAQVSSRIGGAMVLLMATGLLGLF